MKRRDFLKYVGCGCCGYALTSCSTAPITNRSQLTLMPESMINSQAASAYANFKKKAKLSGDSVTLSMIEEIAEKMKVAISAYFTNKKIEDPTKNYKWEHLLIEDDKTLNAWCMPGGKIAVYTGILKVTKNIDGLAIVMGHEIAHAVAKHSLERASASMAVNVGTLAADIFLGGAISRTRNTVGQNTGVDILQVGILNPFSRVQETEADYLGLAFCSMSGYDLYAGPELWKRMQEENKGREPPQFLSTHPSSANRIAQLRSWIPTVRKNFPKLNNV